MPPRLVAPSWRGRRHGGAAIGPSERLQEGDERLDLRVRQCSVELRSTHLPYGVAEGRGAAVMEVGRRRRHVAQAGHAEDLGLRRGKRSEDAVTLIEIAADIDALMTRDAAERLEQPIAVPLLG